MLPSTQLFRAFWALEKIKFYNPERKIFRAISHLLGFQPVTVLDQGDPMSQVEVEVVERTMLHAQSSQGGPVNLSSQILEKEPGGPGASSLSNGAQV